MIINPFCCPSSLDERAVGACGDDMCEESNGPIGGNDTCGSPKLTSMTKDFSWLLHICKLFITLMTSKRLMIVMSIS
jgi:hypothetical protein